MANKRDRERREIRYTDARKWSEKQGKGFEPTAIKLPEGVGFFSPKVSPPFTKIDILPYFVGKGNPNADEGMTHYERTYFAHKNLGLQGKSSYCCLAQTFGVPCPVCDELAKRKRDGVGNPKVLKAFEPKVRMLWNVIDLNDRAKGVQVWDTPYYKGFGERLKNKIDAAEEFGDFFKLKRGKTLQLSVVETSFATADGGAGKFNEVTNIEMISRKEDYEDDILDRVVCLDDCLVEMDYAELKAIFLQERPVSSGTSTTVAPGSRHLGKEADHDEEANGKGGKTARECKLQVGNVVMFEDVEYEIKRISADGTLLTLETEEGETRRGVAAEDVEKVKVREDVEEAAPRSRDRGKDVEDEDVEEEEGDEEEEEEEEPRSKAKPAKKKQDDDDWMDEPAKPQRNKRSS